MRFIVQNQSKTNKMCKCCFENEEIACSWDWKMRYEGNPKHKEPWQRGKRGSRCPSDFSLELAQKLLNCSESTGSKRFSVHEGHAYCAQCHGNDCWHGYPVGWVEVPPSIRNNWLKSKLITRHEVNNNWG